MPNRSYQLQLLSLPNGKVERSHRIDDEEFWTQHDFASFDDADAGLGRWEQHYNHERFSLALAGRTPAEALGAKLQSLDLP